MSPTTTVAPRVVATRDGFLRGWLSKMRMRLGVLYVVGCSEPPHVTPVTVGVTLGCVLVSVKSHLTDVMEVKNV